MLSLTIPLVSQILCCCLQKMALENGLLAAGYLGSLGTGGVRHYGSNGAILGNYTGSGGDPTSLVLDAAGVFLPQCVNDISICQLKLVWLSGKTSVNTTMLRRSIPYSCLWVMHVCRHCILVGFTK